MTKYEEYAILSAQIKALTDQKSKVAEELIEEVSQLKDQQYNDPALGKFSVIKLKKWTYTEEVDNLKEAYEERKAKEESEEIATYVEKPSLRFTQVKL